MGPWCAWGLLPMGAEVLGGTLANAPAKKKKHNRRCGSHGTRSGIPWDHQHTRVHRGI